jgi:hypothetical protein
MAKVRLTQIDGKLPNLALMKLSHWHKAQGDEVALTRSVERGLFEPDYDIVYGSVIFALSQNNFNRFLANFPTAIIGGTGTGKMNTVEEITGEYEHYDYSIYPEYQWSIGFTQRGCRLNCPFCVVPKKEGRPRSVNTIWDIYRSGTPKNICLLDNDFFGQPKEQWLKRISEIKSSGFKVAFNQGVNIRLITDEAAYWLAQIPYYDDQFKKRRLYTAWDNLRDEKIFFDGVDRLEKAGVPPYHLMVYMLIGFDPSETWERIFYRFNRMVERGIRPYPMVYDNSRQDLRRFQRWVVRRYYEVVSWADFTQPNKGMKPTCCQSNFQLPLAGGGDF